MDANVQTMFRHSISNGRASAVPPGRVVGPKIAQQCSPSPTPPPSFDLESRPLFDRLVVKQFSLGYTSYLVAWRNIAFKSPYPPTWSTFALDHAQVINDHLKSGAIDREWLTVIFHGRDADIPSIHDPLPFERFSAERIRHLCESITIPDPVQQRPVSSMTQEQVDAGYIMQWLPDDLYWFNRDQGKYDGLGHPQFQRPAPTGHRASWNHLEHDLNHKIANEHIAADARSHERGNLAGLQNNVDSKALTQCQGRCGPPEDNGQFAYDHGDAMILRGGGGIWKDMLGVPFRRRPKTCDEPLESRELSPRTLENTIHNQNLNRDEPLSASDADVQDVLDQIGLGQNHVSTAPTTDRPSTDTEASQVVTDSSTPGSNIGAPRTVRFVNNHGQDPQQTEASSHPMATAMGESTVREDVASPKTSEQLADLESTQDNFQETKNTTKLQDLRTAVKDLGTAQSLKRRFAGSRKFRSLRKSLWSSDNDDVASLNSMRASRFPVFDEAVADTSNMVAGGVLPVRPGGDDIPADVPALGPSLPHPESQHHNQPRPRKDSDLVSDSESQKSVPGQLKVPVFTTGVHGDTFICWLADCLHRPEDHDPDYQPENGPLPEHHSSQDQQERSESDMVLGELTNQQSPVTGEVGKTRESLGNTTSTTNNAFEAHSIEQVQVVSLEDNEQSDGRVMPNSHRSTNATDTSPPWFQAESLLDPGFELPLKQKKREGLEGSIDYPSTQCQPEPEERTSEELKKVRDLPEPVPGEVLRDSETMDLVGKPTLEKVGKTETEMKDHGKYQEDTPAQLPKPRENLKQLDKLKEEKLLKPKSNNHGRVQVQDGNHPPYAHRQENLSLHRKIKKMASTTWGRLRGGHLGSWESDSEPERGRLRSRSLDARRKWKLQQRNHTSLESAERRFSHYNSGSSNSNESERVFDFAQTDLLSSKNKCGDSSPESDATSLEYHGPNHGSDSTKPATSDVHDVSAKLLEINHYTSLVPVRYKRLMSDEQVEHPDSPERKKPNLRLIAGFESLTSDETLSAKSDSSLQFSPFTPLLIGFRLRGGRSEYDASLFNRFLQLELKKVRNQYVCSANGSERLALMEEARCLFAQITDMEASPPVEFCETMTGEFRDEEIKVRGGGLFGDSDSDMAGSSGYETDGSTLFVSDNPAPSPVSLNRLHSNASAKSTGSVIVSISKRQRPIAARERLHRGSSSGSSDEMPTLFKGQNVRIEHRTVRKPPRLESSSKQSCFDYLEQCPTPTQTHDERDSKRSWRYPTLFFDKVDSTREVRSSKRKRLFDGTAETFTDAASDIAPEEPQKKKRKRSGQSDDTFKSGRSRQRAKAAFRRVSDVFSRRW